VFAFVDLRAARTGEPLGMRIDASALILKLEPAEH